MRFVIVDDEHSDQIHEGLGNLSDRDVHVAADEVRALEEIDRVPLDVCLIIVLDLMFPRDVTYTRQRAFRCVNVLEHIRKTRKKNNTSVLLVSGADDLSASSFARLESWLDSDLVADLVLKTQKWEIFKKALSYRVRRIERDLALRPRFEEATDALAVDCEITTEDPYMARLWEQITRVANSSTSVLIRGEPGTGKTLLA